MLALYLRLAALVTLLAALAAAGCGAAASPGADGALAVTFAPAAPHSPPAPPAPPVSAASPAAYVHPLIGSANGGNTFPGAVVPFGMVQWSPETTRGDSTRAPVAGGYAYDAPRIRGFSLTHLSGTGCRGASGDIPFMPFLGEVESSPAADTADRIYSRAFAHRDELATAGYYRVGLEQGLTVELTATARTGAGRFTFPAGRPATLLVRASDSEVGSSDAHVEIDSARRTVAGDVTSGNFCGHLSPVNRRGYYTLHFVAEFDRPFARAGAWEDGAVKPGATHARGGKSWGPKGSPLAGKGAGAYVVFDPQGGPAVNVRVGISYVSRSNAAANLRAENPSGTALETVALHARQAWDHALGRIAVAGGSAAQRAVFYTALYHALLHPNLASDTNGQYQGFDGRAHTVAEPAPTAVDPAHSAADPTPTAAGRRRAQYANFSGWDVYRSQLQLVALLDPALAGDIAQSLYEQARQNGGEWDRWTHGPGATHVMAGDPSPAAIAGIAAFGGTGFDLRGAFASLAAAATVPTAHDLSAEGCPVECVGQRPALDRWLGLHYIPASSQAWGGAGETLEDAIADFSLAQLARRLGDGASEAAFLARAHHWRNVWNPAATPAGGYIQNRNADGSWPPFDPASDVGFAEGTSAQYTWMVPFDVRGLFDAMGGDAAATRRLDGFFHEPGGGWALTRHGGLHAEMDNEPSIGTPWLYLFCGRPDRTQETIRQTLSQLWSDAPGGIPGNDDLGEMSSWYVWSALGLYPGLPGRAELLLASPLFPRATIHRGSGATIVITAAAAGAAALRPDATPDAEYPSPPPYVRSLRVDGRPSSRAWLPESFVARGGRLEFTVAATPDARWATDPHDAPPSFAAAAPR